MAKPIRHSPADHIGAGIRTFFVSTATWGRPRLLQSDRMASLIIDVLYHYRGEKRFLLHEFVVMPNHIHVLLSVGHELSIEKAVQLIKGGSAYRASHELGVNSQVWERGFSEIRILNHAEFAIRAQYIRENPIRAGLVTRAEQYPYSSAAPGCEVDLPPFAGAKAPASVVACGTTEVVP
jgi:putative transposase